MSEAIVVQVIAFSIAIAAAPGLLALAVQARSLSRRIDGLEEARLFDAAERGRIEREIDELRHGVGVLIAQIRRAGLTPEWTPPPITSRSIRPGGIQDETGRQVWLWQEIARLFDLEEQADLWFEMFGTEPHGDTPGSRARALVMYAQRRNKLDALEELVRKNRLGSSI